MSDGHLCFGLSCTAVLTCSRVGLCPGPAPSSSASVEVCRAPPLGKAHLLLPRRSWLLSEAKQMSAVIELGTEKRKPDGATTGDREEQGPWLSSAWGGSEPHGRRGGPQPMGHRFPTLRQGWPLRLVHGPQLCLWGSEALPSRLWPATHRSLWGSSQLSQDPHLEAWTSTGCVTVGFDIS